MPKHLTTADEGDFVTSAQIGATNGIAQLGSDGKVVPAQLPAVLTGSVDSVNGLVGNVVLTAASVGALDISARGAANGVASLDSTGRALAAQLPANVVYQTSLGVANGIATLGSDGKLSAGQVPTAPVTSVNGSTGAVSLTAASVSAVPTSQKGVANGVATLDNNTLVPQAQIPSLASLYLVVPSSTPARPGQYYSAVAGGSNSGQWIDPLVYTASSAGAMPSTGVPTGALCVRTDLGALYRYTGSGWTVQVPQETGWTTLPLPSGTQGYSGNSAAFLPKYKVIGSVAWIRGRIELVAGGNFATNYSITLPGSLIPTGTIDLDGTATTAGGQSGVSRWQLDNSGILMFFAGSGPNPATPWLGFNFVYRTD